MTPCSVCGEVLDGVVAVVDHHDRRHPRRPRTSGERREVDARYPRARAVEVEGAS